MTITQTVYNYLDNLEDGSIISGWSLFNTINSITQKNTYPSTLLHMARDYVKLVGGDLECISVKESKYIFHKGCCTLGRNFYGDK